MSRISTLLELFILQIDQYHPSHRNFPLLYYYFFYKFTIIIIIASISFLVFLLWLYIIDAISNIELSNVWSDLSDHFRICHFLGNFLLYHISYPMLHICIFSLFNCCHMMASCFLYVYCCFYSFIFFFGWLLLDAFRFWLCAVVWLLFFFCFIIYIVTQALISSTIVAINNIYIQGTHNIKHHFFCLFH